MNETNKLKSIRTALKLTQKQMAVKLDITQSYYSAMERGAKEIQSATVNKLVNLIGVSPNWYYSSNGDIFSSSDSAIVEELPKNNNFGKLLEETRANPNYAIANSFYFSMLREHGGQIDRMISSLTTYWKNTRLLMQFIEQYDSTVQHPVPQLSILRKLNTMGVNEVEREFNTIFKNLPHVLDIIEELTESIEKSISKLKPFDIHSQFAIDYHEEARRLKMEGYKLYDENKNEEADSKFAEVDKCQAVYNKFLMDYPRAIDEYIKKA